MKQNDERSKFEGMSEHDFSNYVSRHDVGQKALNKTLRRAFLQQGQQVLVIGSASAEKTRAVLCNLQQLKRTYAIHFVRIGITESTTVERFIAAASIQLGFARSTRTMATHCRETLMCLSEQAAVSTHRKFVLNDLWRKVN